MDTNITTDSLGETEVIEERSVTTSLLRHIQEYYDDIHNIRLDNIEFRLSIQDHAAKI